MLRLVEGVKALPLGKAKQDAIAQLGYGNNSKLMSGITQHGGATIDLRLVVHQQRQRALPTGLLNEETPGRQAAADGQSGI